MSVTDIPATVNMIPNAPALLTEPQRGALRAMLVERLQQQRAHLTHTSLALDDFSSSDSPLQRESVRDVVARARVSVENVERALRQLDDGTYGICRMCDRPIPFERLEVIPDVRHCVVCTGRTGGNG